MLCLLKLSLWFLLTLAFLPPVAALPVSIIGDSALLYDEKTKSLRSEGDSAEIFFTPWQIRTGKLTYFPATDQVIFDQGVTLEKPPAFTSTSPTDPSRQVDRLLAFVERAPLRAEAASVHLNPGTQSFVIFGPASFFTGPAILRTDQAAFSSDGFQIDGTNLLLGIENYAASSENLSWQDDVLSLGPSTVFVGQPSPVSPRIRARSVSVTDGNRVTLEQPTFAVGQIPLFWFPRASFRPGQDDPFQLQLNGGFNPDFGAKVGVEPTFRLTPETTIAPSFDLYSKRGILLAPAFYYDNQRGDVFSIESGWIQDQGDIPLSFQGETIDRQRGFVNVRGLKSSDRRYHAILQLTPWTDEEVIRDFRDQWFDRYIDPTNFAEVEYHAANWYLLGFGTFRTNSFQNLVAEEPLFEIGLLPTPLPIFESVLETRLRGERQVRRENGLPNQDATLALFDLRLSRQIGNHYLGFRPVGGLRVFAFDQQNPLPRNESGIAGELGFDLTALVNGSFNVQNRPWKIDQLKHEIAPLFGFRYRPGFQAEDISPFVPEDLYISGIPPLSFFSDRRKDQLFAEKTWRTGLSQRLLTQRENETHELLRWDLFHEYEEGLANNQATQHSIYNLLQLSPAPWINYHTFANWDPDSGTAREWTNGITLRDGWLWDATFRTQYLAGRLEQYHLFARYRLNERNRIGSIFRIDGREKSLVEQRYLWEHSIGSSWILTTTLTLADGDERRSDYALKFTLSLPEL
ncbi:MAG: hypothetical protein ACFCU4_08115 [Puniceicoccaceae bacterium]